MNVCPGPLTVTIACPSTKNLTFCAELAVVAWSVIDLGVTAELVCE